MVKDKRSRISLFVAGLGRALSKEGRAVMFIGDIEISRIMVYVEIEEYKVRDKEVSRNKQGNIQNESGQQKGGSSRTLF